MIMTEHTYYTHSISFTLIHHVILYRYHIQHLHITIFLPVTLNKGTKCILHMGYLNNGFPSNTIICALRPTHTKWFPCGEMRNTEYIYIRVLTFWTKSIPVLTFKWFFLAVNKNIQILHKMFWPIIQVIKLR